MRMSGNVFRSAMPASARLPWLAALAFFTAGCSSIPRSHGEPLPAMSEPPATATANAATEAGRSEFTMAAGMLDTWNAVGQILVRLDGVTYEGRAQMLGLYAVGYRGERFLIVTRALVMRSQAHGVLTQVGAVLLDGKPNDSAAAVELLGLLQRRLPAELARIGAAGR